MGGGRAQIGRRGEEPRRRLAAPSSAACHGARTSRLVGRRAPHPLLGALRGHGALARAGSTPVGRAGATAAGRAAGAGAGARAARARGVRVLDEDREPVRERPQGPVRERAELVQRRHVAARGCLHPGPRGRGGESPQRLVLPGAADRAAARPRRSGRRGRPASARSAARRQRVRVPAPSRPARQPLEVRLRPARRIDHPLTPPPRPGSPSRPEVEHGRVAAHRVAVEQRLRPVLDHARPPARAARLQPARRAGVRRPRSARRSGPRRRRRRLSARARVVPQRVDADIDAEARTASSSGGPPARAARRDRSPEAAPRRLRAVAVQRPAGPA